MDACGPAMDPAFYIVEIIHACDCMISLWSCYHTPQAWGNNMIALAVNETWAVRIPYGKDYDYSFYINGI